MKQLVFVAPGTLEWRAAADPQLSGDGEAIVRPLAVSRCDLDVAFLRGIAPIPSGSPIGHECVGAVVSVGDGVRLVRPGDRVIVPAQISCGVCRMCKRGFTGRCETVPFAASYGMGRAGDFGGLVAERIRVPFADAMLVRVPDALSDTQAVAAADMALDAWRATGQQLRARPEAAVLVVGGLAQVIGIYAAALAVAAGAAQVDYWDDDPARLAAAGSYGATTLQRGRDAPGGPYGVIVIAGGSEQDLLTALAAAEPEALVTSVTIFTGDTTPLPLRALYHKGVTFVTGRPNVRPAAEEVLKLCRAGHFDPDRVPALTVPFDQADQAFLSPLLRVVCVAA